MPKSNTTKPQNVAQKLIEAHLVSGKMKAGEEIGLRIDQTHTAALQGAIVPSAEQTEVTVSRLDLRLDIRPRRDRDRISEEARAVHRVFGLGGGVDRAVRVIHGGLGAVEFGRRDARRHAFRNGPRRFVTVRCSWELRACN